jgi:L-serine/L-threonine ammonia-lyase
MPLHIETPLLASSAMSGAGQTVWLKMEALQPPGSFKLRGMGLACQTYRQRGAQRFISSSGGNAGIAAAYCGRQLGVPVTVVVPQTTSERAKALILQQGAELIVHGASWQEANALAQSMLSGADALLHPFDDPLLWQGHATMIDEVARRRRAARRGAAVGGRRRADVRRDRRPAPQWLGRCAGDRGGNPWRRFAGAVDVRRAAVELPAIRSIATSLGARQVCEQAFAWTQNHDVRSALVSDRAAVQACLRFIDDQRVLVEPACGAALALAYDAQQTLAPYRNILVVACGGVTATLAQLRAWSGTSH